MGSALEDWMRVGREEPYTTTETQGLWRVRDQGSRVSTGVLGLGTP